MTDQEARDGDRPGMTENPDPFTEHRPLLFSIAYEITGSVADTEDVLQDGYLRWRDVDRDSVTHPRAYLVQIVTRQALSLLRSSSRRRETYVGTWLPEPLITADDQPDGLDHVLTGEAVTTAMLLVLETLTPAQRATFVLREVFDFSYPEIAAALGRSEEAVRQLNSRARQHVHARRGTAIATPSEASEVARRFSAAAATGDVQALLDVLAPDVVYLSDGGGEVTAVRNPVRGREDVAHLIAGLLTRGRKKGELDFRIGVHNGMHSMLVLVDGELEQVTSIEVGDDQVRAVYTVRNPHKLTSIKF
ncbi:RNA polymerase sigma-70 factor [Saccharopolyspora dendranthemae]|uniref:RNA polymerase sigma-70 factor (ECF subfamily) n=1 Tax=Saccharopolyspora dendranthemae TaxID=1181886 RepID=A0A561U501_9PSEU|nr:RNA polymerase sigma-70 factor [Saccharopolyspora dendranthemae]TWF94438.1 RNA polymerase sigma-70 factor (ECF subfamily) [Saccharopolyspora dendranthemae]